MRMKRFKYIAPILVTLSAIWFVSCDSKRQPGKIYMPDMAYSRAIETYAERDTNFTTDPGERGKRIYYDAMPVPGTIKMGDEMPFPITPAHYGEMDSAALEKSSEVKNPLGPLSTPDSIETARLFNINCAICHGVKAQNNGPIAGKVGGVKSIVDAAPKYADGKIFYIMTYGQGNMGSYASQLTRKQRWQIVQYIRTLQPKAAEAIAPANGAAGNTAAKTDTTKTGKKPV